MFADLVRLQSIHLSLMLNENLTFLVLCVCDVRSSDLKITETSSKYTAFLEFAISN